MQLIINKKLFLLITKLTIVFTIPIWNIFFQKQFVGVSPVDHGGTHPMNNNITLYKTIIIKLLFMDNLELITNKRHATTVNLIFK